ncbi:helix-turn-helix domain-containing protein [Oscillibacter sp.]|uniref:helix-turn-helix domain-containing protein n=1 Tax=Oscillibacter sp. TaxID=1945593 RepID=UPI0037C7E619
MESSGPRYLTAEEAAERLRVSRNVMYEALRSGRLRAIKLGGWRIPEDALHELENQAPTKTGSRSTGKAPVITKIRR